MSVIGDELTYTVFNDPSAMIDDVSLLLERARIYHSMLIAVQGEVDLNPKSQTVAAAAVLFMEHMIVELRRCVDLADRFDCHQHMKNLPTAGATVVDGPCATRSSPAASPGRVTGADHVGAL